MRLVLLKVPNYTFTLERYCRMLIVMPWTQCGSDFGVGELWCLAALWCRAARLPRDVTAHVTLERLG